MQAHWEIGITFPSSMSIYIIPYYYKNLISSFESEMKFFSAILVLVYDVWLLTDAVIA